MNLSSSPSFPSQLQLVRAWGALSFTTLAIALILALVVLVAPNGAILRRSLVAHANLAALLWPVSVLGLLATRRLAGQWRAFSSILLVFLTLVLLAVLGLMLSGSGKSTLTSFMPIFWLPAYPILLIATLFAGGLLLAATLRARPVQDDLANAGLAWFLLPISVTLVVLLWAWVASAELAGHVRAEVVVWGAGHAWQFALAQLMVWTWLSLAGVAVAKRRSWSLAAALPALGVPLVQALFAVDQEEYLRQLPDLLRWALWPVPLAAAIWLLRDSVYRAAGGVWLWLSIALFTAAQLISVVSLIDPVGGGRLWIDAVSHGGGLALALGLFGLIIRLPEFSPVAGGAIAPRAWAAGGLSALLALMLFALAPRDVNFQSLRDQSMFGSATTRKHVESKKSAEVEVRFAQGVRMLQMREYDFAIQAFHRVLELNPKLPEAHVNMGFAFYGKGDFPGAQRFFESAAALNKNQINAYYGLALAAHAQDNHAVALGAMRAWLHLAPADDPFRAEGEAKFDEIQRAFMEQRKQRGEMPASPQPARPK